MSERAGRAADALAAASGAAMGAILVALVALAAAQVALRYALGAGWPWAGDLTIILLLTLAWLGAGHLWLRAAHVGVSLLPARAAARADAAFALLALLAIGVALPMVWGAVRLGAAIDLPALPLPMSAKFVPVLGGLILLAAAILLRAAARRPVG